MTGSWRGNSFQFQDESRPADFRMNQFQLAQPRQMCVAELLDLREVSGIGDIRTGIVQMVQRQSTRFQQCREIAEGLLGLQAQMVGGSSWVQGFLADDAGRAGVCRGFSTVVPGVSENKP